MASFRKSAVLAAAFLLVLAVQPSRADVITLDLGIGNSAISGYPGPYAGVEINLADDDTHATITFTSLVDSGNIYLLGDGGSVAVNVNATNWTLGTITGANAGTGFTPGPWSDRGAGNEDGFGLFNQTIKSFDGFTHSSDTISFILTNTSGTWASAADVLAPNSLGYLAAAHIFVTSDPANTSNGALATGYAANGGSTVPDGGMTVTLLGLALAVMGVVARRLK